ncbi:hypothetical protein J6I39_09580 [bacterium]|nr:hypothetical protein [bacterium]
MISEKDTDSAMSRNYMQRMEYFAKEYELTKQGNPPRYRFVTDFYKAHNIHRQNFLKYYHRYKESNNPTSFLPRKRGANTKQDEQYHLLRNNIKNLLFMTGFTKG